VDHDRDVDPLAIGVRHDPRRADLHAQVSLVVIERAEHQDVSLEHVLTVRPAGAEREEAAVARLHLIPQLGVRDVLVADEGDAAPRSPARVRDLEGHDHLVFAGGFDLVRDVGEEVALLG